MNSSFFFGGNFQLGHNNPNAISSMCGKLFFKKSEGIFLEPKQVECLNNFKVKDVSAGFLHTVVLTEDNQLLGFGRNTAGILGKE